MDNLKDNNYKEKTDDELFDILHSKVSYALEHKKAAYELHRRNKEFEHINYATQRKIRGMTFLILIFTIIILVLTLIGLFK